MIEINNKNNAIHTIKLLSHAKDDPVNPKIKISCKKCNYNFAKQIRINQDMTLINICINCNNKWIN